MTILQEINSFFQTMIKNEFIELSDQLLLTDEDQTIFRLRYVDKLANDDIANALNIRLSKVNNELFTIRQKLSKLPIFTKEKFNPDTASEYAMRERCRKLSKSKDYADFCDLAEKYNYTIETVKKYKTLRRKELNK